MVQHLNVPALKQSWVLDAQWTDCPPEVEADVKRLWRFYELGNDHYMLRDSIKGLKCLVHPEEEQEVEQWDDINNEWVKVPLTLPALIPYLEGKGIPEDENIIIHWWW